MNLREAVITSLDASTLASSEIREMPVDRVAAMGRMSELGAAFWRIKYHGERGLANRVALLLVNKMLKRQPRLGRDMAEKIARQVVQESVADQCRPCGGTGAIASADRSKPEASCRKCNGTGMHRYGDYERAAALGLCVDVYRKAWTRRFDDFAQALSAEDAAANRTAMTQLERA